MPRTAAFPDVCSRCPDPIDKGDQIVMQNGHAIHARCASGQDEGQDVPRPIKTSAQKMVKKSASSKPWLSGQCNKDNPAEIHATCRLEYRGKPCSCLCHMAPDTPPNEKSLEPSGDPAELQATTAQEGGLVDGGSTAAVGQVLAELVDVVGFHPDIPEVEYHAHAESLSHTGAKLLLKAPALFNYRRQHPVYKKTFDFGSAAHALVLGAGIENIYVAPFDNWLTKQAKLEKDLAHEAGLSPILPKDWLVVADMADALSQHRKAMELLSIGTPEVSAFAVDEETGVLMRCRYDWHRPRIGVDYKSTVEGGADPDEFVRTAHKLGYFTQQDWYSHVAEILGQPLQGFGFIVQEKEPPYLVTVVELPVALVELGRDRNRVARQRFRDCTESGLWPAYLPDDQIAQPPAPDWILRKAAS